MNAPRQESEATQGAQQENILEENGSSTERTLDCGSSTKRNLGNEVNTTSLNQVQSCKRIKVVDSGEAASVSVANAAATICSAGKKAHMLGENNNSNTNNPTRNKNSKKDNDEQSIQYQQDFHRFSAQSVLFTNQDDSFPRASTLLPYTSHLNLKFSSPVMSPSFFASSCRCCDERSSRENATEEEITTGNGTDKEHHQHLQSILSTNITRIPTITDNMAQLFQSYYSSCALYNCQPNPGVLVAIRYSLPSLRVSGSFHDADMLALSEVLIPYANTPTLSYVKRLDFGRASLEGKLHGFKGFKSHGAFALSRVLLTSKYISEVFVQRHRIGPYGAAAIFAACQENPTVKILVLRRCLLGVRGAQAFAQCVVSKNCGLREVDLSNCRMGYLGTRVVNHALVQRKQQGLPTIDVDIEGNLIIQEIMNSVTHGLGIFLAMLAAIALMKRTEGRPAHSIAACSVYSVSLLFLYTCSTLYHSFFALRTTRFIFGIIDKCAIYILIAGSYTPYLAIGLVNKPKWSVYLLTFIWLCCFFGICVEAFFQTWKRKGQFSLAMYLGMGWACLVCIPDLIVAIPKEAFTFLVMGGVGYTAGVPFFVRNTNLDHSIWHMFVLMASMFHWLGVYSYVVFL